MESNHNKDFDRQVKKKFEDFSAEVPPTLWTTIEKEIEPGEVKIKKVFNLKRYRYISIAAALLIIGFTIWKIRPEEKIFLSGQGAIEKTVLVQEPEVKQSADERLSPLVVEKDNEPVLINVSEPRSVAVVNDDDNDQRRQDSQTAIEKKTEEFAHREPILAVNAPVENDNSSLIDNASAISSLNKTLDVMDENLDSLYQGPELAETKAEERQNIVSGILNFVAGNLQIGGDRRLEFTENEHGIIKIGLKR